LGTWLKISLIVYWHEKSGILVWP